MSFVEPFKPVILSHPRLPLSAHVIPLGLNITRLIFQNPSTGETHDVIAGPEDPEEHWSKGRTFLGPLVGRYANRLPAGKCKFPGGEMDIPEFSGPGVCLHGGPEVHKDLPQIPAGKLSIQEGPLDRLIWIKLSSMQSQFFGVESPSAVPCASAIFGVVSAAGSNGFPGTVRIEARLSIEVPGAATDANGNMGRSAGVLKVDYRAQIIDDCEATPFNITQHWGFNLSASDAAAREAEKGTVDDHTMRMMAIDEKSGLYTLGLDGNMIPTGSLIKCDDGGEHDWLEEGSSGLGRPIKKAMTAKGYDHFYAWGTVSDEWRQREILSQPRLILHSPATKLSLTFKTNQSGTQFYNAAGQLGGNRKFIHKDDPESPAVYAKRNAVVLEFAHPHATFLHEEYQQLAGDNTILKRNERYRNWVEVELYKN